jgi:hypothetical protein
MIEISNFTIKPELKDIYEFEAINYSSTGLLGDFIQNLSVINENFLKMGKKGNLFMTTGHFNNGLENTYKDTYELISTQNYIKNFQILKEEKIDIDLSSWFKSKFLYRMNWYYIYNVIYDVDWGRNKWLNVPVDIIWQNRIIINEMNYRPALNVNFKKVYELFGDQLLFVSFDKKDYDIFTEKRGIKVEYYKPSSLMEAAIIINSCKLLIASLSSFLAIGHAVNVPRVIGHSASWGDNAHNDHFQELWKNIYYGIQ